MAARSTTAREDWGHLLSVGSLVGGVLVILLLGAFLRTPTSPPAEGPAVVAVEPTIATTAPAARPEAAQPEAAPPEPAAPAEATAPVMSALENRVAADLDRLPRVDGAWTAQLAVLCDGERARRLLEDHGDLPRLYLLPATHQKRACVRACWGGYPGPDEARAARDLPAVLRKLQASPLPRRIAEVTR